MAADSPKSQACRSPASSVRAWTLEIRRSRRLPRTPSNPTPHFYQRLPIDHQARAFPVSTQQKTNRQAKQGNGSNHPRLPFGSDRQITDP